MERANRRFAYSALFTATSSTLSSLARAATSVRGDTPDFFDVLHAWGRNLQYHPHIHYVVPAGAFDSTDHRWHSCPHAFYLPVRVMSKQIKSRFFKLMRAAGLLHLLPKDALKKRLERQFTACRQRRTIHPVSVFLCIPYPTGFPDDNRAYPIVYSHFQIRAS